MFSGSMVALVTPMKLDGSVDYAALEGLVDWHLAAHTNGLVVLGTTGEAAQLSLAERTKVISTTVDRVAGRIPVIVGTGCANTEQTIANSEQAQQLGADGCLVVTPYYVKPTQAGLVAHYAAVADAVNMPIILYNVPGRTGVDLGVEATLSLAHDYANIIGIKDATADFSRLQTLLACKKLSVFSGDDMTSLEFMLAGGHGVISVTANVLPSVMAKWVGAALQGEREQAMDLFRSIIDFHRLLFIESNPIPTKWLLQQMGWIDCGIRLPLTPLTEQSQTILSQQLLNHELLQRRASCV